MTPKKKISTLFFHHSPLKYFEENFQILFIFSLQLMTIYEKVLTNSYCYSNTSREKTAKAAKLAIFDCIDKSLSELLKKSADQ
jgi:hypothetical protein